ncbi:MAG: hypothetical protein II864_07635 [Prevotella sp.]|nr:hypothetical protein [Prevotella sp.]
MENRRKFYPDGLWGKDTLQDRYQHVMGALDAYKNGILDDQDLVFVIKNAFVSKIYVSEGVAKAYPAPQPVFGNLSGLYDQLLKNHVLDLQDTQLQLNTTYMKICELGTKVSGQPKIRVEHVVPGKVFMDDVKKITSFGDFKKLFDAVSICLVTDDEDQELNANGLRSSMPSGVSDFTVVPLARYNEAEVVIF